ncbi:hypothetical protein HFD88_006702 [Aspergillus terreus]|nr:hypothetical protein HFD88_006702 [Aspergillus terreus]
MSPILLLIFKEYAGKYHLLNAPGLPVKTVTSLINSSNTSPFVDTMLLMSVTDVLTDARFSGYAYKSSFYASKPAHVYVLLEKHDDPLEDDYETIAHPLRKIPEPSVGVQTDLDAPHAPDWGTASWFPGDDSKFNVTPVAAAKGVYETYPGGYFYKYITPSSTNRTAASENDAQLSNTTTSSHTVALAQSVCDWDHHPAENLDEWCDARPDDVLSVATTEPYEEGFHEAYYGKRGGSVAVDDTTPETETVQTPGNQEWHPREAFVQDEWAKPARW